MSDDFDDPDPRATPPPGDEFYVYPRDDRGEPFDDDDDQDRGASSSSSSSSFAPRKTSVSVVFVFLRARNHLLILVADDGYLP